MKSSYGFTSFTTWEFILFLCFDLCNIFVRWYRTIIFTGFDPEQSKSVSQSQCVCYPVWSALQRVSSSSRFVLLPPFTEALSWFSKDSQIQANFCPRKNSHDLSHRSTAVDSCCSRQDDKRNSRLFSCLLPWTNSQIILQHSCLILCPKTQITSQPSLCTAWWMFYTPALYLFTYLAT